MISNRAKANRARMIDITGETFNRLTVVSKNETTGWDCVCSCGNKVFRVTSDKLKSGNTKSCGCLQPEVVSKLNHTHGMSRTPTYYTWVNMRIRCYKEDSDYYYRYGGRGITVCDRWKESFSNFLEDMGPKPEGTSIERLDNDKGYYPENCVWASPLQQALNRSNSVFVTYSGTKYPLMVACEVAGVEYSKIFWRVHQRKTNHQTEFDILLVEKDRQRPTRRSLHLEPRSLKGAKP